jgi:hypothetical protein
MPRPTPGEATKALVIPGLTRNPVRFSNYKNAALRAGENDSGFRIKSGMTRFLDFRRAWIFYRPAILRSSCRLI